MPGYLIPRADAELNNFGISFTQQLNEKGAASFGLSDEQATAFTTA